MVNFRLAGNAGLLRIRNDSTGIEDFKRSKRGDRRNIAKALAEDSSTQLSPQAYNTRGLEYEKTGVFYRLPTEAEWEYACRAGTRTTWFFGDDPIGMDQVAWYYGNSGGVFHPGGKKAPNPWGLYDMYGNVAEWTLDQYQADYLASLSEAGEMNP